MKNCIFLIAILLAACAQSNTNPGVEANPKPSEVMCTMDAMQCPDGSWVGRSPPSCAFNCPPAAEK